MQDRIPVNPGRVLITPENGSAAYYATMTRADNPTQEGTPLNKSSLLKDATAALFGLGADAVPDDAFTLLSRFQNGLGNEYVWLKTTGVGSYVVNKSDEVQIVLMGRYDTWTFYRELTITDTGAISLSDSFNVTPTMDISTLEATIGCYFKYNNNVFEVTRFEQKPGEYTYYCYGYPLSTKYVDAEILGYVNSPDPNAYPVDDGYIYTALGQLGAKVQIATGSYTGTGTYGASNPNSLTFDFVPKVVFISAYYSDRQHFFFAVNKNSHAQYIESYKTGSVDGGISAITSFTNTLSWYSEQHAMGQMNASGATYNYIAIG